MTIERLTFDNGNFKAAMENFKNTKTKEREAYDRAMTDENNELNDLQVRVRSLRPRLRAVQHLFQSAWGKISEELKQYEKKYGKNLNAERLSKMINKANVELKENNEQLIAEKGITNGIKKRRLMLQEMSGFEISGNVHFTAKIPDGKQCIGSRAKNER